VANQKEIRTRIGSVKNTQKITRAMKMVAGARLTRAQTRISEMRPYAQETASVLRSAVAQVRDDVSETTDGPAAAPTLDHFLLDVRPQKGVLLLVLTSDRGLCGAFNSSLLRQTERKWRALEAQGKTVKICVIGRKGRDYFTRRNAPLLHYFDGIWDDLGLPQARRVAHAILKPYIDEEVDAIHLLYNEFKSAMTQVAVDDVLFPLSQAEDEGAKEASVEYIFEPDKKIILDVLVPMYIEVTLLRALYESMASELGARMTAMDSATKNASDMIDTLTLQYNRARQAAITTELMEIIGGSEALNA
jgi:F-type H+-transporting ATPase subunit gamma